MGENICKLSNRQAINLQNIETAHEAQYQKKKTIEKIGRKSKQMFLQRRHTGGQKAPENILNITNYQRNANQTKMSYYLTLVRMVIIKILQTVNSGEGVQKREPSHTVGGNVNWYNHYGEQYERSLKTKHRPTV